MEREISSGAMLGIVLLALAAVIGLGFGIFAIAKGVANDGTVGVQDSLGTVSTQAFLDYDQKVITGTQATSALKQFDGKGYAVLIATKALTGGQVTAAEHTTAYVQWDGTTRFINYNAILANDSAGALATVKTAAAGTAINAISPTAQITLTNGTYITANGFVAPSGNVKLDSQTAGVFKSGNGEYIPSSTKFQANLIKDNSGAIVGIALRQI